MLIETNIYRDISLRSNGDIYIGVVGPVRTGKSTFISKFMDELVLPNLKDNQEKQRIIDELPQMGQGKAIMTTQPKFVPNNGVKVTLDDAEVNVRLIDCVGYPYEGAQGFYDDNKERMVKTPWSEDEMPFSKAAILGTNKVMNDHSNIGIVITNDGSIVDIERASFKDVEREIINNMKNIHKPFIILLNSKNPNCQKTKNIKEEMQLEYDVPVIVKNIQTMNQTDYKEILEDILLEFPIKKFEVDMPKYLQCLNLNSEIMTHIMEIIKLFSNHIHKMCDYKKATDIFKEDEYILNSNNFDIDYSQGKIVYHLNPRPELFYKVLSDQCGENIENEYKLVSYIRELSKAKIEYDKIKDALEDVKEYGYGVVTPDNEDMELESPEIVKKGNKCIVRLKASAPSYHIMRVDVETEVNPILGGENQTEEFVQDWLDEYEDNDIWQTNMFGKSLNNLAKDNLAAKVMSVPDDVRYKMRKTLSRIVNEGKGGVLCVLL